MLFTMIFTVMGEMSSLPLPLISYSMVSIMNKIQGRRNELHTQAWGRLTIKMAPYQYRDPPVKDNTISQRRPYFLWHGNCIHGKTIFLLQRASVAHVRDLGCHWFVANSAPGHYQTRSTDRQLAGHIREILTHIIQESFSMKMFFKNECHLQNFSYFFQAAIC